MTERARATSLFSPSNLTFSTHNIPLVLVVVLVSLVPFTASFLAEPMVQSSHPPLVAKIQAKILQVSDGFFREL